MAAAAVLQFRLNYCFVSRPVKIAVVGPKSVSSLQQILLDDNLERKQRFGEHAACAGFCVVASSLSLGHTDEKEKSRLSVALES